MRFAGGEIDLNVLDFADFANDLDDQRLSFASISMVTNWLETGTETCRGVDAPVRQTRLRCPGARRG